MQKFWLLAGVTIVGLLILLTFCLNSFGDGKLHVFMLNVGQGDALLIQTPSLERILVDGGPNDTVVSELANVLPFYERRIDAIFLSHPHADHLNGLVDVLKRYEVGQVFITGVVSGTPAYQPFLERIEEKKIPIYFVTGMKDFSTHGIIFDVIYPTHSFEGHHFENLNNSSLVFRLLYGDTSFYFSGDLELEGEKKLLESGQDLHADVFKAGHHGSRTSNSLDILSAIQPKLTLISCGVDNSFKHPHPETIQHFQNMGIKIFRTDLDGRVEVISDGRQLMVGNSIF